MANIRNIKSRICQLSPAAFQELCDALLSKKGYKHIYDYGMRAGTGKTTTGNPDSYCRLENGKYMFAAYTTQMTDIFSKLKEDIEKCLDPSLTGIECQDIEEIICCFTSSNLGAGNDQELHKLCEEKGAKLTILGIDEIASELLNYPSLCINHLGLSIDTGQILDYEDFITLNDSNGMSAPLSTTFQYREEKKAEIINSLNSNSIVIVTGKPGVGKTRLVLEVAKEYSETYKYQLLCVKSNQQGLYQDYILATEQKGSYLLFIDDANMLAELKTILDTALRKDCGNEVKIILTVRDYAKKDVISVAAEEADPAIIVIPPFSDEELKGFIKESLGIRNEDYLAQIITIAEGNPRIAYMAGRLAKKEQNLSSIHDVSGLFDKYYGKYLKDAIGDNDNLCFSAGVLSVVNAVILNDLHSLDGILTAYGISETSFKQNINILFRAEVVEIQCDQVAVMTDQSFANYMIYYVFFERKLLPFSDVLETGYIFFRNGIVGAISTIFSIFYSESSKDYCRQQVLKVWNKFQKNHVSCFDDFAKTFHIFNPIEGFKLAITSIRNIPDKEIEWSNIDFNTSKNYCAEAECLSYLTGYQNSDHMTEVLDILFEYCKKSPQALISGSEWLTSNYGIDLSSEKFEFHNECLISSYLLKKMQSENSIVSDFLCYQWGKYGLNFDFSLVDREKRGTYAYYHLMLHYSDFIAAFRQQCWQIILFLSGSDKWKDRILLFMKQYSKMIRNDVDPDIVKAETGDVMNVLNKLGNIRFGQYRVEYDLRCAWGKLNIPWNNSGRNSFSKQWQIYSILMDDCGNSMEPFQESKSNREQKIKEFGKNLRENEIGDVVTWVNEILEDPIVKEESFSISQSVELIVSQFDSDRKKEFLHSFVRNGSSISIRPFPVLASLTEAFDPQSIYPILEDNDFPQKNEWEFSFFEALPSEKITAEWAEEFLCFLKRDTDRDIKTSRERPLKFLEGFQKVKPGIFQTAAEIIYQKKSYSSLIVSVYFCSLFQECDFSPKELLVLFQGNLNLLQDIYFFMIGYSDIEDYNGVYLSEFLKLDNSWLHKYSDVFWTKLLSNSMNSKGRIQMLWRSEDYQHYFDYLFWHSPDQEKIQFIKEMAFSNAINAAEEDAVVKEHQENWIKHLVKDHSNSEEIVMIFKMIRELNEDYRRTAVETFLQVNSDIKMFRSIDLLPSSMTATDSFEPVYQEEINFLKSIYPLMSGSAFIDHRLLLQERIEHLEECIKEERIHTVYRKFYDKY